MGDTFAFLLPITMFTFATAFLIIGRWGSPSATPWGLGYFCAASGFCMAGLPFPWVGLPADALFALAFLFYGEALLDRQPELRQIRIAVCLGGTALCGLAIHLGNLRAELVLSDFTCVLLMAIPLLLIRRRLARPIDAALFGVACLVTLENAVRGGTAFLTAPAQPDALAASEYAFIMQTAATILGMVMALTALARVTLDVVAGYRAEALTDPLSGLLNRRGFENAVAAKARGGLPEGSIVSCDIDHFKRVNDRYGHAAGDVVIVALAAMLKANLPAGALAARFGGEEFVVYLPTRSAAEATRFANTVRLDFSGHDWRGAGIAAALTASFGLSGIQEGDASLHDAIGRADEGLYEAKNAGRDRVAVKLALVATGRPARADDFQRQTGEPTAG